MELHEPLQTIIVYGIGVVCGILIELFFQLLKSVDRSNNLGIPLQTYTPLPIRSYLGVIEYINGGAKFNIFNYLSFRLIPPLLIFTLQAAILSKYFPQSDIFLNLLISFLVSITFRDLYSLFLKRKLLKEKIIHFLNILLVLSLVILIALLSSFTSLAFLAPTDGVVDNLWSSLLGAALVAFYIGAINKNEETSASNKRKEKQAQDSYITMSYSKIERKYGADIKQAASAHNVSEMLIYSMLIYENMNRPAWIRKFENVIVRFLKIELTVGIAQVKSRKPLSDSESIQQAAIRLADTANRSCFLNSKILENEFVLDKVKKYNGSDRYIEQIRIILDTLSLYPTDRTS